MFKTFLENTFFTGYRDPTNELYANFSSLELMFNYKCNLSCIYCYGERYGDDLYPLEFQNDDLVSENLDAVIKWIKSNGFYPRLEIFTGEALVQNVVIDGIDRLIDELADHYSEAGHELLMVVPTNFSFLLSDTLTERITKLLDKAEERGALLKLSASFDGKIMESNRPFKANISSSKCSNRNFTYELNDWTDPRDDAYYDKCFKMAKKYNFGFHPMIYSRGIEKWKDNFIWFQEMFQKHNMHWSGIYLLEVRNQEWSKKQCKELEKFVRFLFNYSYTKVDSKEQFVEFIFKNKGFNILNSAFCSVGRGLGCGLQSSLYIRLGDLALVPCHRMSYEHLVSGYMIKNDEGDIVDIKSKNLEFFLSEIGLDAKNLPYCVTCPIKHLCSLGCLGAQYESTGDPMVPIRSVCRMEHYKIKGIIDGLKDIGMFDIFLSMLSTEKKTAFLNFEKMVKENE